MNERTVHAIEIIRNWMVMNQYNTEESESSGNRDQMDFYSDDLIKCISVLESDVTPSITESLIEYILAFDERIKHHHPRIIIRPHGDRVKEQYSQYSLILDPALCAKGKWPSKYSACFMQVMAINLFINRKYIWPRLLFETGMPVNNSIFSVNGPPGTGKTTLLKEIIAHNIVEKANIMARLESPDDLFSGVFRDSTLIHTEIEVVQKKNGDYYNKYIRYNGHIDFGIPCSELVDLGITVACGTNRAAENISMELPRDRYIKDLIQNDSNYAGFRFFNNIRKVIEKNYETQNIKADDVWGLISATLGKSENNKNFVNNILVPILEEINPPGISWSDAKKRFLQQREKVNAIIKQIEAIRKTNDEYLKTLDQYKKEFGDYAGSITEDINKRMAFLQKQLSSSILLHRDEYLPKRIDADYSRTLNWFTVLFARNKAKTAVKKIRDAGKEISGSKQDFTKNKQLLSRLKEYKDRISKLEQELYRNSQRFPDNYNAENHAPSGMVYLTPQYVKDLSDIDTDTARKAHLQYPWSSKILEKEKEKLFLYAYEFSMKFALASEKLKSNLSHLANLWTVPDQRKYLRSVCIGAQKFKDKDNEESYGSWDIPRIRHICLQTLSIIFPVTSTTFASIEKLFPFKSNKDVSSPILDKSIGTLIIDEAGQVSPYTALGAMFRSSSVLAVGDPLQVPPVVPAQERIKTMEIDDAIWVKYTDENASVQSFSDCINPFGALQQIGNTPDTIWLGCPLTIHRRCLDPMFSISNKVSYGGSMINATVDTGSYQHEIIETSSWEDIKSEYPSCSIGNHYVEEQGLFIAQELGKAFAKSENPSVFVISPFKDVTKRLIQECRLAGMNEKKISERIGTIHTFQGREANEVFIVLGCDKNSSSGSFSFVSSNIVNVAVSRAKKKVCFVGDRQLWTEQNSFLRIASEELERYQQLIQSESGRQ